MLGSAAVGIGPHNDAGVVDTLRVRASGAWKVETLIRAVNQNEAMAEGEHAFLVIETPDELSARVDIAARRPCSARKVE